MAAIIKTIEERNSDLEVAVSSLKTALTDIFIQTMNRESIPAMSADDLRDVLRDILDIAHTAVHSPNVVECQKQIENRAVRRFATELSKSMCDILPIEHVGTVQTAISLRLNT